MIWLIVIRGSLYVQFICMCLILGLLKSRYEALCKKFILGETLVKTNGETARQGWEISLPMIYIWSWYLCLSIVPMGVYVYPLCLCLSFVSVCLWCISVHGVYLSMVHFWFWCMSTHGTSVSLSVEEWSERKLVWVKHLRLPWSLKRI